MANFFIISEEDSGIGLAVRLKKEGHGVAMNIKDPNLGRCGEGLVDKDYLPGFNPILIGDCTGSGAYFDAYREAGGYVFGSSQVADRLEEDRAFSSEVFKSCGIAEPDSQSFTSWEEGESFASEQKDVRLVFKPEGRYSGRVPSYVSKDLEDLLSYMKMAKNILGEAEPKYVLQEFIEGICISSEAWYAKDHFVLPYNHTLERKQFLCDDLGPSGGCTGNVVWACSEYDCPLCRNLSRLSSFLEKHEYNGCIDINSVVDKEGNIYALEFTPRFGYDAFPTLLYALYDGDFGSLIEACAKGRGPYTMPLRSGFGAGVRISTPPWPSEDHKSKSNLPIRGLRGDSFESFYAYEVTSTEDGLATSGGVGIIGVAVGYGSSIEGAFEEAYKIAEKIELQDKQYRTDLAEMFKSDLRKLTRSFNSKVLA